MFAGDLDSANIYRNQNTVIFVNVNSVIHGNIYIASSDIALLQATTVRKKKLKPKPKDNTLTAQHQLKKNRDAVLYKNIQKQIDRNIEFKYDPSSQKELGKTDYQSIANSVNSGNAYPLFFIKYYMLEILKIPLENQPIYSSVSFLQFSRLLDSFLRGPPSQS